MMQNSTESVEQFPRKSFMIQVEIIQQKTHQNQRASLGLDIGQNEVNTKKYPLKNFTVFFLCIEMKI